jgi:hypothetical protein
MADYCRNMEPIYTNKAVVQICALCWLFLLRLIMHGTNIKLCRPIWKYRALLVTLIIVNVIWVKFCIKTEGYNRGQSAK